MYAWKYHTVFHRVVLLVISFVTSGVFLTCKDLSNLGDYKNVLPFFPWCSYGLSFKM